MKKIYESKNSIIEIDTTDNIVYKTLKHKDLSSKWFEDYKKLCEKNDFLVKVYNLVSSRTYTMEYLPIYDTLEHCIKDPSYYVNLDKLFIIDIIETFHEAFLVGIRLSKTTNDNLYFLHSDLKLANIIVTTDKQIKVIDPDSYFWHTEIDHVEKYYMNQINLMFCLQRVFHAKNV